MRNHITPWAIKRSQLITWRRSFAEYWKYFVARLNDVHAFGYNSAGSERIWMKLPQLYEYIVWGWPWRILGAIRAEATAGDLAEFLFFFCQENTARLCGFPVSQLSRNLHTRRGSKTWCVLSE